ncbi:MAG: nuclear transport factor 2 family protein [Mucilaginibacter sp.]
MVRQFVTACLLVLSSLAGAQSISNKTGNQLNTKNMKNEAKLVVTKFLTAVQQGDNAKLAQLIHPDIIWSQPGSNCLSGTKHSNAEVFQMVGKMFELSANTLRLSNFKSISVNGNKIACLLHWNAAQPAGGILDIDNIDVYTVENGQITKAEIFTADEDGENRFWGE